MSLTITLQNRAIKNLREGQIWFFESDVLGRKPHRHGIYTLMSKRGEKFGSAFVSPEERHFIRVITTQNEAIDYTFWQKRIQTALSKRETLEKITNAYRVVFAESDGIPSVMIDKYNDIWSVQISSIGALDIKDTLVDILKKDYAPASIILKKSLHAVELTNAPVHEELLFGSKTTTTITEGDQLFELDVLNGQKTGAYLDYRNFRFKARDFAKGKCLDACCYHGWLSCQIADKAERIVAIDSSKSALKAAKKNSQINHHQNIEFKHSDVFDFFKTNTEKFDFIHLDPPPFAKGAGQIKSAMTGYHKLISLALSHLKDQGTLLVSSCSHAVSYSILDKIMLQCLKEKGFKGSCIFRGQQDSDHPVLKKFSESLYLKAVAYVVGH